VHQIQEMSETALERLLGGEARALKRRAHGFGGTTLSSGRLPRSMSRETTLSRDLRDAEELSRSSPRWWPGSRQLREEQLVARTVTSLRHDDFHTVTRRRTLRSRPTRREIYGTAREPFARPSRTCAGAIAGATHRRSRHQPGAAAGLTSSLKRDAGSASFRQYKVREIRLGR
jgi:hypothetical protein